MIFLVKSHITYHFKIKFDIRKKTIRYYYYLLFSSNKEMRIEKTLRIYSGSIHILRLFQRYRNF